jgi:hypothetical protein
MSEQEPQESKEEYISLQDAAFQLGVERPAMYYYIKRFKIEKKKFDLNKQVYLKRSDFDMIKEKREFAQSLG